MIELIDSTQTLDSTSLQTLHSKLQNTLKTLCSITTSPAQLPQTKHLECARIHLANNAFLLQKDIEVLLLSQEDMRDFNQKFMGKDYSTDVLSFPLAPLDVLIDSTQEILATLEKDSCIPQVPLGSIAINLPLATSTSDKYAHHIDDELCLLFIHGLLHLLGFDHEDDMGEHRALESLLIDTLALPSSLIDRTISRN